MIGDVEITISAAGDEHALEQFYDWLSEDVDIARSATVELTAAHDSGRMGAFEAISMVLSNATGLAGLAIAYANWRRARKDAPKLTFTTESELSADERETLKDLNEPPDQ